MNTLKEILKSNINHDHQTEQDQMYRINQVQEHFQRHRTDFTLHFQNCMLIIKYDQNAQKC